MRGTIWTNDTKRATRRYNREHGDLEPSWWDRPAPNDPKTPRQLKARAAAKRAKVSRKRNRA